MAQPLSGTADRRPVSFKGWSRLATVALVASGLLLLTRLRLATTVDAPATMPAIPATRRRHWYFPVAAKFAVAQAFAVGWMLFSVWLSIPWLRDLSGLVTPVPAFVIILLVAYIPGWLVAFLAISLVLDRQPRLARCDPGVPVTIVIAARNEADQIADTLGYIAKQDYRSRLDVLVLGNGSTDGTSAVAEAAAAALELPIRCITETRPGQSHALNTGLAAVETELVITLDADTLLHADAVRHLVGRLVSSPPDVQAVAGSVLVRNSRD